jgi:hypothetical protein
MGERLGITTEHRVFAQPSSGWRPMAAIAVGFALALAGCAGHARVDGRISGPEIPDRFSDRRRWMERADPAHRSELTQRSDVHCACFLC